MEAAQSTRASEGGPGGRVGHTPAGRDLAADWLKAARFYAAFGITEAQFRQGIPRDEMASVDTIEFPKSSQE